MAPYMGLRGGSLQFAISAAAGLCFFLFGYFQGDMGGMLTIPSFLRQFPRIDTLGNPGSLHVAQLQGVTMATWNIGCFVSAILTIWLGDVLGRKKTIFMGTCFLIIGEVVQCTSFSYGQFVAGRFIAGFGNGFNTATVPAWQAECVKAHQRGTMLMVSAGACIAAGLSFSYWITFAFAYLDPSSAAWRIPIAIEIFFALVALVLIVFLPESPRWLVLGARVDEALTVLAALNDSEPNDWDVQQEFMQIKDAVLEMSAGSAGLLFKQTEFRYLHRTLLAYIVQIFQQMSGINFVTQYMALMFVTQTHYAGWLARLLAACLGTAFFLASFVAVVGIDRFWGRRSLMMFGATGMCICMVLLTVMIYLNSRGPDIAATVFYFAFCIFFAIGWQGMAWLYQVEIVPLRVRGPANALSTSANWLLNFAVVLIAPIALHNIGYKTYIIFAAINFAIIPAVYFFYPETGYRSLEEIDVIFASASQCPRPYLAVVRSAETEPLWYGKRGQAGLYGGADGASYEKSDWHLRLAGMAAERTSASSSDGLQASSESAGDMTEAERRNYI
ncbi:hypothetical protein LTR50_006425 [Elasticomyces elasticus]|nr:hypothetical protein LTR50_006425 [Elasticomyces elasticus]